MGFQDLKNEGSIEFSISIFLGLGSNFDLVLASVHQFRVYESEESISDSLQSTSFDIVDSVMKDVTKEIME